jgi:hypothetical protein
MTDFINSEWSAYAGLVVVIALGIGLYLGRRIGYSAGIYDAHKMLLHPNNLKKSESGCIPLTPEEMANINQALASGKLQTVNIGGRDFEFSGREHAVSSPPYSGSFSGYVPNGVQIKQPPEGGFPGKPAGPPPAPQPAKGASKG